MAYEHNDVVLEQLFVVSETCPRACNIVTKFCYSITPSLDYQIIEG